MATLCRDWRLLFIHGRRTGSTAVRDALDEHLGGVEIPPERSIDEEGRVAVARHSNLPALLEHGVISADERRDLLTFTTVRNPFDDQVSLYLKNRQIAEGSLDRPEQIVTEHRVEHLEYAASHPFHEYAIWRYTRPGLLGRFRAARTAGFDHTGGVDLVLRFERLQEDFDALLERIGYRGSIKLPRTNVTVGRRSYRDYYTPRARKVIERAWASEIERYDYAF